MKVERRDRRLQIGIDKLKRGFREGKTSNLGGAS
jgi:hypothetical protein